MKDNPFDILEVDPRADTATLTKILRKRIERASEDNKLEIQTAWQNLTLKESERLRWALLAHPRPSHSDPSSLDHLKNKLPPAGKQLTQIHLRARVIDTLSPSTQAPDVLQFQPLSKPV